MNLSTAICDDDRKDAEILRDMLLKYSFTHDIDMSFDIFIDGNSLKSRYTSPGIYNIIFMDIEMPGTDGITTISDIRNNIDRNLTTVFVSSYPEYMCESLTVHPYQFLQKPVKPSDIETLMNDIVTDMGNIGQHISITDNNGDEYTIHVDDICYIETVNSRTRDLAIHLFDDVLNTRGTLKKMEQKIDSDKFIRCSRTLLVNLSHIHYIKNQTVYFDNRLALDVSIRGRKLLRDMYEKIEIAARRI